jgi:hypothetical protein
MTTTDQLTPATVRQQRFLRAVLFVLVDVTVLALFVEHWDRIVIDSYTITLFTAVVLQALLKATIAIEHRIAAVFVDRSGPRWMAIRLLATWMLLFGSKFVILGAVDVVFGEHVELGGLISFIILVVVMLAAEAFIERIYDALA